MKTKSAGSMIKVYLALWTRLMATGGISPTTHILVNEVSAELETNIKKESLHTTTCTSRPSQTKPGGKSNTNIQKSCQNNLSRSRQQLSNATMGQTASTNNTHVEPTPTVEYSTDCLSISIRLWKL
jgi:hypothetical protein